MKTNTIIYDFSDWDGLSGDKIAELGNRATLDEWNAMKLDELWTHICKTNSIGDRIIVKFYGNDYEDFILQPEDLINS